MSRKEQLNQIDNWCELLDQVQQLLRDEETSGSLDEYQRAERLQRVKQLQAAVNRLKESVELTSPFAMQPSTATADVLDNLEAKVTREAVGAMRLMHQTMTAFADTLAAYEQETHAKQLSVDFSVAKKQVDQVVEAYKRLGSRKLHEQKSQLALQRLAECDAVREKMGIEVKKVLAQVKAAAEVSHDG